MGSKYHSHRQRLAEIATLLQLLRSSAPARDGARKIFQALSSGVSDDNWYFQLLDWLSGFVELAENYIPVAGLFVSLLLQLTMLLTGWLRKRNSAAIAPAWLAYVISDSLAIFLLGFLTQPPNYSGVYGLWGALLIYHLGGPDNLTAYERADSELWMRHLLDLVVQVATATYVIAVNTRGWLLIPTLIVFVIGVTRYWERNMALRNSSRKGINKEMTPIYIYMMNFFPRHPTTLEFLLAGGAQWYHWLHHGDTEEYPNEVVTTGDVGRYLEFSTPELKDWAVRLTVARASATAYLRRLVFLARGEQFQQNVLTRSLWFEEHLRVRDKWLPYIRMEQSCLHNLLYTKPVDLDRALFFVLLRMFSSILLVVALLTTIRLASEETWDGLESVEVQSVVTYIVLAVGSAVEVAYLGRLLLSKDAVVAMLVAQVRVQRRIDKSSGVEKFLLRRRLLINKFVCERAMRFTIYFDDYILPVKSEYIPPLSRQSFLSRIPLPSCITEWVDIPPDPNRGWEMLSWTFQENADGEAEFSRIQACQDVAVNDIFDDLLQITKVENTRQSEPASVPSSMPIHSEPCMHVLPFYNSDWEHVLTIFWLATLKVLKIENESKSSSSGNSTSNSQPPIDDPTKATSGNSTSNSQPPIDDPTKARMFDDRTKATWQMLYVSRLLTVCPQLLPTQLDVTMQLVERHLARAEASIKDPSSWLEETKQEISSYGEQLVVEFEGPRGKRVRGFVFAAHMRNANHMFSDCERSSNHLAVLLLEMEPDTRWDVLKTSACWFIACLAQSLKADEHCEMLRNGGELLTTLWILSSELGGGAQ